MVSRTVAIILICALIWALFLLMLHQTFGG